MEGFTMARRSKREYLRSIYERYRQAQRAEKKMMLEEFWKVCGYNRKYAIWLLNRPLPETTVRKRSAPHSPTYSRAMVRILAKVWEASGYLYSQRLKAALVHWLPWIRQHFELTQSVEDQLLAISARQMDRRLRATKHMTKLRVYDTPLPPLTWSWSPEREIPKSSQPSSTRLRQLIPSSSLPESISNCSGSTSWPAMQTEHRGKGHR